MSQARGASGLACFAVQLSSAAAYRTADRGLCFCERIASPTSTGQLVLCCVVSRRSTSSTRGCAHRQTMFVAPFPLWHHQHSPAASLKSCAAGLPARAKSSCSTSPRVCIVCCYSSSSSSSSNTKHTPLNHRQSPSQTSCLLCPSCAKPHPPVLSVTVCTG